jgi:two-component system, OmpR family, sensor histidine kinase KdpD
LVAEEAIEFEFEVGEYMGEAEIDLSVVGQLLALLAHDLRNPLSALHSNVAFLGSVLEGQDQDVADALTDGLVSCDGLNHIIDNIDLLGQYLRKSSVPPRGPLSPFALVDETVKRCARTAHSHNVTLRFDAPSVALAEGVGVRDLLARALSNLIHNAIQHSSPRAPVVVTARPIQGSTEVIVLDQSPALAESNWSQVFTADGQIAAKSSAHGRYSRGLGLFAAQLAAVAGGGSVQVVAAPHGYVNALSLRIPER